MEASVIHERQKLHNLLPYANLVPKNGSVVLVMWRELYFLVLNRKKEHELLCSSLVRPFSLTGRFVNKHSSPQLLEATDRWDDWLIRVARHTSSVRLCLVVDATTACPPARATQRNVNRTSLRDLLRGQASGHVILFRVRSNRYNVRYSTSFPSSHKHLLSGLVSAFKLNTTDDLADISELNKTTWNKVVLC